MLTEYTSIHSCASCPCGQYISSIHSCASCPHHTHTSHTHTHRLAELATGFHDAKAEGYDLRLQQKVDHIRVVHLRESVGRKGEERRRGGAGRGRHEEYTWEIGDTWDGGGDTWEEGGGRREEGGGRREEGGGVCRPARAALRTLPSPPQ
jgi:hypothetical protein